MRRPPYHRGDRGRLDVKMTPMIDVIFLLLIFFVSTASFRAAEEILPTNLSLPGTTSEIEPIERELEDLEEIVVKILWRDGRPGWQIESRGQQISPRVLRDLEELQATLRAVADVQKDLPVIIDVEDKDKVLIEDVIDVCDVCRRIGLEKVRFAASVDQ